MAGFGRFVVLTDEHIPNALVEALRQRGWCAVRVVDELGLGRGTLDDRVFAHAAKRGWVWLSRDEAAQKHPVAWQREGQPFVGMVVWSQRYHRMMSIGDVVRSLEALTEEEDPFAAGVRHVKP